MAKLVDKIVTENKMTLPPSKDNFMRICKSLNMHCTEMLAYEGLRYCRGQDMEEGAEEDFDFDRMIAFLNLKSKMVAPADNPRYHLTTKDSRNYSS